MARSLAIAVIVILGLLSANTALADTRVTVHDFSGPSANRLRDDVVNLLERQSGVTIVSRPQIERTAFDLGVDPYTLEGRKALARELQLSAWLTGEVKKRAGQLKLTVVVYDGAQETPFGRTSFTGASPSKLSGQIRYRLWPRSRRAILLASATSIDNGYVCAAKKGEPACADGASKAEAEVAAAPEPPPPAPVAEPPAEVVPEVSSEESPESTERIMKTVMASSTGSPRDHADKSDAHEASKGRPGQSLRASLGFGSPYRSLVFRDRLTQSLTDYQLSGAPMVDLNVAYHPARVFTDKWLSWLALDLRMQLAGSASGFDRYGNQFDASYFALHVGMRGRVPVGDHYLSAFTGYALLRSEVTYDSSEVTTRPPSVDYRMIRSGVGAEFALAESVTLGFDAAWLQSLSVGEIAEWFPRATAGGLELGAFGSYHVTRNFFARIAATYQRVFFDFNSKPEDQYVAGGAVDHVLALSAGAGVSF